jgi:hypothetical protein
MDTSSDPSNGWSDKSLEEEIAFGNQLCISLAEHLERLQAGGIHRIVARENAIIEIVVTVKARV